MSRYTTEERRVKHCAQTRRYLQRKKAGLPPLIAHVNQPHDVWKFIAQGELTDCWLWTRSQHSLGYAFFKVNRRLQRVTHIVFQLTFPLVYDPLLDVLHKCDNPSCCNPFHLRQGTHSDNMQDCIAKGRLNDRRGELNGRARATTAQVMQFRALIPSTRIIDAARLVGLTRSQANQIAQRKTWRHLL